jgi:hypothetical protein
VNLERALPLPSSMFNINKSQKAKTTGKVEHLASGGRDHVREFATADITIAKLKRLCLLFSMQIQYPCLTRLSSVERAGPISEQQ